MYYVRTCGVWIRPAIHFIVLCVEITDLCNRSCGYVCRPLTRLESELEVTYSMFCSSLRHDAKFIAKKWNESDHTTLCWSMHETRSDCSLWCICLLFYLMFTNSDTVLKSTPRCFRQDLDASRIDRVLCMFPTQGSRVLFWFDHDNKFRYKFVGITSSWSWYCGLPMLQWHARSRGPQVFWPLMKYVHKTYVCLVLNENIVHEVHVTSHGYSSKFFETQVILV